MVSVIRSERIPSIDLRLRENACRDRTPSLAMLDQSIHDVLAEGTQRPANASFLYSQDETPRNAESLSALWRNSLSPPRSRKLKPFRWFEAERAQADDGSTVPAFIEPRNAAEMDAVAVDIGKRRQAADRLVAATALPSRPSPTVERCHLFSRSPQASNSALALGRNPSNSRIAARSSKKSPYRSGSAATLWEARHISSIGLPVLPGLPR